MSFRAGVGPMLARSLGVESGGPRVICDGCGLVLNVRDDRPPPAWLLDDKSPKGWATTKREDGTRDDRCPRCRPTQTRKGAWHQLEQAAAEQNLRLFRTPGCVTVETLHRVPYVTITTDRIDRDDDADRVVRAALGAALEALRSIE